jgi:hypothetical protein
MSSNALSLLPALLPVGPNTKGGGKGKGAGVGPAAAGGAAAAAPAAAVGSAAEAETVAAALGGMLLADAPAATAVFGRRHRQHSHIRDATAARNLGRRRGRRASRWSLFLRLCPRRRRRFGRRLARLSRPAFWARQSLGSGLAFRPSSTSNTRTGSLASGANQAG